MPILDDFSILPRDKAVRCGGVVYEPVEKLGIFSGWRAIFEEYFTPEALSKIEEIEIKGTDHANT